MTDTSEIGRAVQEKRLLFEPFLFGDLKLPNRIVLAPLTRMRAFDPSGVPNVLMREYYEQRASAGLIITEGTFVSDQARGWFAAPGIYTESQRKGWQDITDAVHRAGGRIIVQLWHQGSVSNRQLVGDGRSPLAPSAINPEQLVHTGYGRTDMTGVPQAMSREDIRQTIGDFRHAAQVAQDAGFDGVQIQGGFVYLFQQFLQENLNLRTDEYGGTIENRARLLFEVLEAVLEVWPSQRVGVKAGPMMPERGGFQSLASTLPTSEYVYLRLNDYHLSHVMKMRQLADLTGTPLQSFEGEGVLHHLRPLYQGTLILNAGIDAAHAEELLQQGLGELIAFGREYIANPDLVERFRLGSPLNEQRPENYYGSSAEGYTDYPTLAQVPAAGLMPDFDPVGTIAFFRERHRVESAVTRKVLSAMAPQMLEYRPHPSSSTAGTTAWTIVRGLNICNQLVRSVTSEVPAGGPPNYQEILGNLETESLMLTGGLLGMSQLQWKEERTVTANGRVLLQQPLGQIFWLFHVDAIHHRGQISTYLRGFGAKVPSIYGPSGDSPA